MARFPAGCEPRSPPCGFCSRAGKADPAAPPAAAVRFEDQAGYDATSWPGVPLVHPAALAAAEPTGITLSAVLVGLGCAIGSGALAFAALLTGAACPCCATVTNPAPG